METQQKYVLTPIAGAVAAALCPAHQAAAQDDDDDVRLDEIIVTATKRTVGIQDIPASIQAITSETIAAMGAKGIEDYARFIPAVNVINYGAGNNTVVFRGAITGGSYISQSTSSVYLNEQSLTQTGEQPMIRMVDIERVEALAGPQGTLYGSDAQAGTMRIITNKPQLNEFEAIFDGELRGGEHSDMSYRGSLIFNIPLVDDKLAARVVLYNDRDGGFIDNVLGSTPDTLVVENPNRPLAEWDGDPDTFPDSPRAFNLPAEWGTLDNAASVEKRWNDADIIGGRLSLLWQLNDSWSVDLMAVHQEIDGGAGNDYDPFVGDLQTVRFHNEWFEDEYDMFSLVVNADLGFADLVAAVSYYEREVVPSYDVTIYGHYWGGRYCIDSYYTTSSVSYYDLDGNGVYDDVLYPYYWENPDTGYIVWYPVYCMGETLDSDYFQGFYEPWSQDKLTVEIRLNSQGETFDWIVGFYRDESNDSWGGPFAGPTTGGDGSVNLYQDSISLQYMEFYHTYWTYYDGNQYTYPEAEAFWMADSDTDWEQTAFFGEVKWHLTDALDLTLGGRYFDRTNNNLYRVDHPGDLDHLGGEPDTHDPESREFRLANNNRAPNRKATETEFIPKVSLSYGIGDDRMVYGLYTQGTRPGGVNRSRGEPFFSKSYASDTMDNYEIGYRSTFGKGRGRFNVTAFHMVWSDYQLSLTDPSNVPCPAGGPDEIPNQCGQPWQSIVTNAGDAHISGINVELDYAISDSWLFGANAAFLEAETDTTADITGDGEDDLTAGLRLPLTPEVKGSAWLDYTVPAFGDKEAFARLQTSYTGDSMNRLNPADELTSPNPQFKNEAYMLTDVRAGVRGDDWEVSIFVNNITDERAIYTIGSGQMNWAFANVAEGHDHFQKRYVARPREFGVRYKKRWGN
jgi:outer membrane receptor protein involved in Fe transport